MDNNRKRKREDDEKEVHKINRNTYTINKLLEMLNEINKKDKK